MDKINNNHFTCNEIEIEKIIVSIQKNINSNSKVNNNKLCTFIYGDNGVGKTTIVKKILNKLNYNIHEYNIFSQKNKNIIEFCEEYCKQNRNILDIFYNKNNNGIILIDNIDLINSIDKNTLTSLIKILRPKKSKKNGDTYIENSQIVIIGNNDADKKIKELMKLCNIVKIPTPSENDIINSIKNLQPKISETIIKNFLSINKNINYYLIHKFISLYANNNIDNFINYSTDNFTNNNVKYINYCLFKKPLKFDNDSNKINDTDKTTVSLLFHENIIDYINSNLKNNINIYKTILDNFCFGDYMDRIIFQKQLWQLNELSFKIKVVYNNMIFHNFIANKNLKLNVKLNNIRFTKILTKYSSEFNNYTFIINMCQCLDLDKKDLIVLIFNIKNYFTQDNINYLNNKYNISLLDINRLIKYVSIMSTYES